MPFIEPLHRIGRRLLTGLTVLSLLLCVASLILWVRSKSTFESIEGTTASGAYWQFFSTQQLGVLHVNGWPEDAPVKHISYDNANPTLLSRSIALFFFGGFS